MADTSWFMAEHLGVHHGDRPVAILAATGENEQSLRDARAPVTPRTCRSCAVSPVLRQSSLRTWLTRCATAAGTASCCSVIAPFRFILLEAQVEIGQTRLRKW